MSIITIPPSIAEQAREAAIYDLGLAAEEIHEQSIVPHPKLEEPLGRFERMRALLDSLPAEPDMPAQVDDSHRGALLDALWGHAIFRVKAANIARSEGHTADAEEHAVEAESLTAFIAALASNDDREGDA